MTEKMGSRYSCGTRNKSGLNVVLIAQCAAMPGMNMHRSLLLPLWDEGLVKWQALHLIYSDLHITIEMPVAFHFLTLNNVNAMKWLKLPSFGK